MVLDTEPVTPVPAVSDPLKVFISYAHEDEIHREALGKHLRPLERENLISIWHDRRITGGREWAGAIDSALKDADIILLLISADFVDSDYSNDVELKAALRMHEERQARVVPIILRSVDWQRSLFASLNALPPDGQPIVEAEHPDQQFTAVAKGLRDIVKEIQDARAAITTAPSAEGEPAVRTTGGAPPKTRRVKIKIKIWGIELGPFEFDWPPRVGGNWLLRGLGTALVLALVAGLGAYFFFVQAPMTEARDDMRIARYDLALKHLERIPTSLDRWPRVGFARDKARLGRALQEEKRDNEELGRQLDGLAKQAPNDPDLLVMQAQKHLDNATSSMQADAMERETKKLLDRATAATQADEKHAEAWNLRGLGDYMMRNPAAATEDYRRAADNGPDSPQYRSNYARSLLEQGQVGDAVREYGLVKNYALARVEGALALWAQGNISDAGAWQREALKILDDDAVEHKFYNRRSWVFFLPERGVELIPQKDKRCYAQLGLAVTEQFSDSPSAPFPPPACSEKEMWVWIRKLVADDICRFLEMPNAQFAQKASLLRQRLGEGQPCITESQSSPPRTNT
jgi:tetratricopeptide (TPR) repeat protein